MVDGNRISIWFFIGSLLAVYGIIIVIANVPALTSPSARPNVVLADLHAGIWWGALLVILGIMYVVLFRPGRKRKG